MDAGTKEAFVSAYMGTELTVEEIAELFGVSLRTVHNWRRALGLEKRRDRRVYVERNR